MGFWQQPEAFYREMAAKGKKINRKELKEHKE